jgi:hypothetical protein
VTDRFEHLADLPIAPFAHGDPQCGAPLPLAEHHDFRRFGAPPVDGHAARQPLQVVGIRHPGDHDFIDPRHAVARVRQPRREISVVGEQQQPFRVVIEATDRIDVLRHSREQVHHRGPPLRIRARRHIPARLVQQNVTLALRGADATPVHANVVAVRVGLGAQLTDGRPVDGDPPLEHQLLGGATRRHAGLRQDFL